MRWALLSASRALRRFVLCAPPTGCTLVQVARGLSAEVSDAHERALRDGRQAASQLRKAKYIYRPRTFCIVPALDDAAGSRLLSTSRANSNSRFDLSRHQERVGSGNQRPVCPVEAAHDYVVYLAEPGRTSWSRLCLSQADAILVAVRDRGAKPRRRARRPR